MKDENVIILETILEAAGKSIPGLPRDRRSLARHIMLKIFNLLSAHKTLKLLPKDKLNFLADLFNGLDPIWFLTTISSVHLCKNKKQKITVLIKNFHGFILQPQQGLLTQVLDGFYENAVSTAENMAASRLPGIKAASEGENRESFELVRGEDGS